MWEHMHQKWITKCNQLHDPASEGRGRMREELVTRVRAMYELSARVNQYDREIFSMPLEERVKLSTRQLQIWTAQFTPVIAKAVVTAQLQGKRGHKDIRQYYKTLPAPASTIPRVKLKRTKNNQQFHQMMKQQTIMDFTIHDDTDEQVPDPAKKREKQRTKTPHKEEEPKKYKNVSLETMWSLGDT